MAAPNILMPPSSVSGMRRLDRTAFETQISVPALIIPLSKFKQCFKVFKPCLLKMDNFSPIQDFGQNKIFYMNPLLFDDSILYFQDTLTKFNLQYVHNFSVTLTYENFNHETILKAVLPIGTLSDVYNGFSIIGHIVHLQLKPQLLDYKYLIAEVLLDKLSDIKTVVSKVQTIGSTCRNFEIDLLAGEEEYEVLIKENGYQYTFDFSKVFWNPGLALDHSNIVKVANSGDFVFDVFAEVGLFAIPLAKKECIVYANSLHGDSYKWLCCNSAINDVCKYLIAFNLDRRVFIETVLRHTVLEYHSNSKKINTHIIMNVPASVSEFLCVFNGFLSNHNFTTNMPYIYCYFFLKEDDKESEIISKYFKEDIVSYVGTFAPNKRMMRLTYQLHP